jgi:pterin-4a-carbinolamine dehydratase
MDDLTQTDHPERSIFISYRRVDTKSRVATLTRDLALQFGPGSIFVDTDKIRAGTLWRESLETALRSCAVLIVAIGDKWLSSTDAHFRRRIDNEDDWVRSEILVALDSQKPIIPLLFDGQTSLTKEALPPNLQPLADLQSMEIRDTDWHADVERLVDRLRDFGFAPGQLPVVYPNPAIKEPVATEAEINEFLRRCPDWQVQYRRHPTDSGIERRGIGTTLVFRSFNDAMHFMSTAAWGINERNHHPEWQNIWRSVQIWITQFDIGGDITARNIELAEFLMSEYQPYANAMKK